MRSISRALLVLLVGLLSACSLAGRGKAGEVTLNVSSPPTKGPGFAVALYQSLGADLEAGHDIQWVNNGDAFDAMADDIRKAEREVNIVTFIWAAGNASKKILMALADAHARGVVCRVIIDAAGSITFDDAPVRAAGCAVKRFRPIPGQDDLARNHRKIVVVDGKVGYTGGFGIDDKWLGGGQKDEEWRDSNVRVTGPAVRAMQQAFAENWQEAGGDLLPESSFPKALARGGGKATLITSTGTSVVTRGDRLMQLLIATAHERLWIANAYFVPSEPIMRLLIAKAKEGVDVRILTAGDKTDTRVYLPEQRARIAKLLPHGIKAYEYAPTMMHSKTVLVDRELFAVGSQNLDAISLNRLEEAMLVALDAEAAEELADDFEDDLTRSLELKLPKDGNQRVSAR